MQSLIVRRLGFPERPPTCLPFYPRSCGTNFFHGEREENPPSEITELCWIAEGCCTFEIGNESYVVQENESIYRLPGEKRIKCSAPGRRTVVYWAAFDGNDAADFLLSYGYPRGPLKSGKCPVHLFEEIQHSLETLLPSDLRRLIALYTELIGMMGEEHDPLSRKGLLFRDCLSLIQNRYQDPDLNVNTLAEELKVHRTTLDRLFLREIGIPPNRYLLKIRLHHALSLLCCTKDSIAEIASKTGFSRPNYFDRVFRETMGFRPMEYRKRKTEGI